MDEDYVTVELPLEQVRMIVCRGMRSSRIVKEAAKKNNFGELLRGATWFDMLATEVYEMLPDEAKVNADGSPITGNETPKP